MVTLLFLGDGRLIQLTTKKKHEIVVDPSKETGLVPKRFVYLAACLIRNTVIRYWTAFRL